jgi:outer membrane biosynthesis protein TonB
MAPTTAQRNDRTAARRVAAAPPSAPAIAASAPPHFIESVEVDSTVYGLSDRNVEPPIAVLPQQLGSLPAGARREDYYTIEVVVNEQGGVDSARVTETPLELGDTVVVTMSLSAVKSWLFLPAMKDGKPVRYRTLIPVSLR